MPEVPKSHCILFWDKAQKDLKLPGILITPLVSNMGQQQAGATKIDGKPGQRSIALADNTTVERLNLTKVDGLAIFVPITDYYT